MASNAPHGEYDGDSRFTEVTGIAAVSMIHMPPAHLLTVGDSHRSEISFLSFKPSEISCPPLETRQEPLSQLCAVE